MSICQIQPKFTSHKSDQNLAITYAKHTQTHKQEAYIGNRQLYIYIYYIIFNNAMDLGMPEIIALLKMLWCVCMHNSGHPSAI
jgi:hypothetical protein